MVALEIALIITLVLIGAGICSFLVGVSICAYKDSKKMKILDYLQTYYKFYYTKVMFGETDSSIRFADDIYFVMDKRLPYEQAEELARLLEAIGYCKKENEEDKYAKILSELKRR